MKVILAGLVTLFLAAPVRGQDREAEKLFQDALVRLQKAKALKIVYKGHAEFAEKERFAGEGMIILAEGDRHRLSATMQQKDKMDRVLSISDGTKVFTQLDKRPGKTKAAMEEGLNTYVRETFSRAGVLLGIFQARPAPRDGKKAEKFDAAADFPVSKLELRKNGMVDGRPIIELTYSIDRARRTASLAIVLQLDAKTLLPVRRTITLMQEGKNMVLTETYEVTVDPMLDGDTFQVPAETSKEKD